MTLVSNCARERNAENLRTAYEVARTGNRLIATQVSVAPQTYSAVMPAKSASAASAWLPSPRDPLIPSMQAKPNLVIKIGLQGYQAFNRASSVCHPGGRLTLAVIAACQCPLAQTVACRPFLVSHPDARELQ